MYVCDSVLVEIRLEFFSSHLPIHFALQSDRNPTPDMAASLLYKLHSHGLAPGVEADKNRFRLVYQSKYGKVRIFKVSGLNIFCCTLRSGWARSVSHANRVSFRFLQTSSGSIRFQGEQRMGS
jgi:hypothetical protein